MLPLEAKVTRSINRKWNEIPGHCDRNIGKNKATKEAKTVVEMQSDRAGNFVSLAGLPKTCCKVD